MIFFENLYNSYIRDDHRDLIALLEDKRSLKPPIDHVMELLPRLQARYYSISSSPKVKIKFKTLKLNKLF